MKSKWIAIAALVVIGGCAAGPNFKKPAPPQVKSYTAQPLPATTASTNTPGGEPQHLVSSLDISGEWWTLFHSKPLNDLVERSLKASPDIKAAQAALLEAHENVLAQKGGYYPSVSAGFSGSRNKTSAQLSPNTGSGALYYSLFTPQVSVSYVPDVFGLNRRTVESLQAQADQQRFALVATHITLSANVVSAAVQEASLRAQIAATRQLVDLNNRMLGMLRNQFSKGYIGRLDVAAEESLLAQVKATLPPLLKQLAQQRDLLAVLSGAFPSEDPAEKFELSSLQLPQDLPLSLPSRLVEQRPDVRQAEANLHSASAQIGIAAANRLPSFMLTGDAGSAALTIGKVFAGGSGFWDLGASVTQPIFEGGMLMHRERAAKAAYVQAAEQYKSTVLTAFQNVADTLNALEQDASAFQTAAEAQQAAKVSLDLTTKQVQTGYGNYLELLNAEQSYQQAMITLVQAEANRYADTAALFQALGGGWWNRSDLPKS